MTKEKYLIDTGADISVIPKSRFKNLNEDNHRKVTAANGLPIKTYGTKILNIDLGLGGRFRHEFVIANTVAGLCPAINDFVSLPERMRDIKARPAAYHVGAKYLTAETVEFRDSDATIFLGRLATFGHAFMPNSTIMRSPHVRGDSYKNYDDYNIEFETLLTAYRMSMRKTQEDALKHLKASVSGNLRNYEAACTAFNVVPNDSLRVFFQKLEDERDQSDNSAPVLPQLQPLP